MLQICHVKDASQLQICEAFGKRVYFPNLSTSLTQQQYNVCIPTPPLETALINKMSVKLNVKTKLFPNTVTLCSIKCANKMYRHRKWPFNRNLDYGDPTVVPTENIHPARDTRRPSGLSRLGAQKASQKS